MCVNFIIFTHTHRHTHICIHRTVLLTAIPVSKSSNITVVGRIKIFTDLGAIIIQNIEMSLNTIKLN